MAIGLVKDDEFAVELERINNPTPRPSSNNINPTKAEIVDMPSPGRKSGDNNVPMPLRKVIAENAYEEGSKATQELAKLFGVSASSVSAYKNGATSTDSYHQPNKELKETIDLTKGKIATRAKNTILKAIKHITDDKLEGAKATDLSQIARNLSGVVTQMEPEVPKTTQGNGPTFVFYTPPQKKEEAYDVIVLKE